MINKKYIKMKNINKPLYNFCEESLNYHPVSKSSLLVMPLIIVFIFALSVGAIIPSESQIEYITNTEEVLLVNKNDTFNEKQLIEKIKELNLPYPHITLAQAKLESGEYSSRIFKENHNLFGMREARVRINLAKGTQYNHAYYNNWKESVLDYSFWYASYARKCKTEDELFQLLGAQYAEATYYVQSLKQIIKKENLKSKFN